MMPNDVPATSDPHFNDGYWWSWYADGVYFFCGLRVHANNNVMDGYAGVVKDGVQHNVRVSRALRPNPNTLRVGPLAVQIVDPLKTQRLTLGDNPSGVTFDVAGDGVLSAVRRDALRALPLRPRAQPPDPLQRLGARHGHRDGRWAKRSQIDNWFGGRDHSWGIRSSMGPHVPIGGVGEADDDRDRRALRLWVPFETDRDSGFFHLHEDRPAAVLDFEGRVYREDGDDRHPRLGPAQADLLPGHPAAQRRRSSPSCTTTAARTSTPSRSPANRRIRRASVTPADGPTAAIPACTAASRVHRDTTRFDVSDPAGRAGPDYIPRHRRLGGTEFATHCTGPDGAGGMAHVEHMIYPPYEPVRLLGAYGQEPMTGGSARRSRRHRRPRPAPGGRAVPRRLRRDVHARRRRPVGSTSARCSCLMPPGIKIELMTPTAPTSYLQAFIDKQGPGIPPHDDHRRRRRADDRRPDRCRLRAGRHRPVAPEMARDVPAPLAGFRAAADGRQRRRLVDARRPSTPSRTSWPGGSCGPITTRMRTPDGRCRREPCADLHAGKAGAPSGGSCATVRPLDPTGRPSSSPTPPAPTPSCSPTPSASPEGCIALGVRRGDHVGILMPNCMDMVGGVLRDQPASVRSSRRSTPATAPPSWPTSSRTPTSSCCSPPTSSTSTSTTPTCCTDLARARGAARPARAVASPARRCCARSSCSASGRATGCWAASSSRRSRRPVPAAGIDDAGPRSARRSIGLMVYTSGTTANPKGCQLTHRGLSGSPARAACGSPPARAT